MYDYREHIMDDIRDYISNNVDLEEYRGRRDELEDEGAFDEDEADEA